MMKTLIVVILFSGFLSASQYQYEEGGILRLEDGAHIPQDDGNSDYLKYLEWVQKGGKTLPAKKQDIGESEIDQIKKDLDKLKKEFKEFKKGQ